MTIIEFQARFMEIMKVIEFQLRTMKIIQHLIIPKENVAKIIAILKIPTREFRKSLKS